MPCPGPFHCSHIADYITFVLSLTQILVFLSLYVMLSILLSIFVCAAQVCSVLVWSVSMYLRHMILLAAHRRCTPLSSDILW